MDLLYIFGIKSGWEKNLRDMFPKFYSITKNKNSWIPTIFKEGGLESIERSSFEEIYKIRKWPPTASLWIGYIR